MRGAPSRLAGLSVVVVDDDRDVREALACVLETFGARVSCARDGLEGLARVRERRPDAIVCDLRMPGLDGLELLRRVRADPRLAGAYVVLHSAWPAAGGRPAAGAPRFDAVVSKPADPAELVAALAGSLRVAEAA